MPLPLGHTAIGLLTYECAHKKAARFDRLKMLLFIIILANLPDIDVIFGLIMKMDGNIYHRGPTHSLLFAVFAGLFASQLWRIGRLFPKMSFVSCTALIFSHTLADLFLTMSPVSLFWPLEVYWSSGHSDLNAVLYEVFFKGYQDIGIILSCTIFIMIIRMMKNKVWETSDGMGGSFTESSNGDLSQLQAIENRKVAFQPIFFPKLEKIKCRKKRTDTR